MRLIRSKGVGVFFVTQTPKDVPSGVLAQLGNRVQHALRAFTPDDAKALKASVSTFPKSEFYDLEEVLTQLGIGEAAVTILAENGVPTPVAATRLRPAAVQDVPGRRRRRHRQGIGALGEVRDARRQRERARATRRTARAAGRSGDARGSGADPGSAGESRNGGSDASIALGGGTAALGKFLKSRQGQQLEKRWFAASSGC